MPQLPVGQHEVPNWPVLDLGDVPDIPLDDWRLEIGGHVHNPVTLDWDAVPGAAAGGRRQRLPLRDDVEPLRQPLARRAHARRWPSSSCRHDDARFVLFTGYDRSRARDIPYTTNLPLARAIEDDVLLVHTWEGRPLPREHGGPVPHDHAEALRVEGHEVDAPHRVPRRGPARILGSARLLEHGRAVVQRPVLEPTRRLRRSPAAEHPTVRRLA